MGIHFYRSRTKEGSLFHLSTATYELIEPAVDLLERKTGLSLDLYGDTKLTDNNAAMLLDLMNECV